VDCILIQMDVQRLIMKTLKYVPVQNRRRYYIRFLVAANDGPKDKGALFGAKKVGPLETCYQVELMLRMGTFVFAPKSYQMDISKTKDTF
jgi:hypothetical protein